MPISNICCSHATTIIKKYHHEIIYNKENTAQNVVIIFFVISRIKMYFLRLNDLAFMPKNFNFYAQKNEIKIKIIIYNVYAYTYTCRHIYIWFTEHGRAATGLVLFHYTGDISHTSNVNNTYYRDKGENTKIWNFNPTENGKEL